MNETKLKQMTPNRQNYMSENTLNDKNIDITIQNDEVGDTDYNVDFDENEETLEQKVERLEKETKTLKAQKEHFRDKYNKATTKEKTVSNSENREIDNTNYSLRDTTALVRANVHEDDIDKVADYAKYKKISISEALNLVEVKSMLEQSESFRTAKSASHVGNTRKANNEPSNEEYFNKVKTGNVKDDVDFEKIFKARKGL